MAQYSLVNDLNDNISDNDANDIENIFEIESGKRMLKDAKNSNKNSNRNSSNCFDTRRKIFFKFCKNFCINCCGIVEQEDYGNINVLRQKIILGSVEVIFGLQYCYWFQVIIHNKFCNFLFKCGCTWEWDGGWKDCKYHNHCCFSLVTFVNVSVQCTIVVL